MSANPSFIAFIIAAGFAAVVANGQPPAGTDPGASTVAEGNPAEEQSPSELTGPALGSPIPAQGNPPAKSSAPGAETEIPPEIKAELQRRVDAFKKKSAELEKAIGDQRIMHILYLNREKRTKADREAYYQKRLEVRKLMDELFLAAVDVLRIGFEKDSATYIVTLLQNRLKHCFYDVTTLEGAARLMDGGSKLTYVYQIAARSAVASGEFEIAKRVFESINEEQKEEIDKTLEFHLERYRSSFEREIEIRAKETEEDRLPRVKLETTEGDVILELFLDQAPSAVSHFIKLVESGYYDGNDFFQVIDNLFALSGDPSGTGSGNSGVFLADEHERPDSRDAFRGSLVMAKVPKGETGDFVPNTGSSQFAILFLPMISVSQEQTVFGRVIEGMENISYLQRVDPFKKKEKGEIQLPPDRILKATVIRRPEELPEPVYINPLQSAGR